VTPAARLAAALVARLAPVLPAPFRVCAEGESIASYEGTKWWGTTAVDAVNWFADDPDWRFAERVTSSTWTVLSSVQDEVSRAFRTQWPAHPSGGEMVLPGTRADEARVHLWYGPSEAAPVIAFVPIEFTELLPEGWSGDREPGHHDQPPNDR
jgi:hypothetical protein